MNKGTTRDATARIKADIMGLARKPFEDGQTIASIPEGYTLHTLTPYQFDITFRRAGDIGPRTFTVVVREVLT